MATFVQLKERSPRSRHYEISNGDYLPYDDTKLRAKVKCVVSGLVLCLIISVASIAIAVMLILQSSEIKEKGELFMTDYKALKIQVAKLEMQLNSTGLLRSSGTKPFSSAPMETISFDLGSVPHSGEGHHDHDDHDDDSSEENLDMDTKIEHKEEDDHKHTHSEHPFDKMSVDEHEIKCKEKGQCPPPEGSTSEELPIQQELDGFLFEDNDEDEIEKDEDMNEGSGDLNDMYNTNYGDSHNIHKHHRRHHSDEGDQPSGRNGVNAVTSDKCPEITKPNCPETARLCMTKERCPRQVCCFV